MDNGSKKVNVIAAALIVIMAILGKVDQLPLIFKMVRIGVYVVLLFFMIRGYNWARMITAISLLLGAVVGCIMSVPMFGLGLAGGVGIFIANVLLGFLGGMIITDTDINVRYNTMQ